MKTGSIITVRADRRFRASAERVFDAWLNVDQARRWLFASEDGEIVRAEIDARVGGRFVFVDRRDAEEVEHVGEYLEIDRPRRLVFVFGVPALAPDMDRVTIEIVPLESGCELTLTHEMDAKWIEYRDGSRAAWVRMLEGIERSLGAEGTPHAERGAFGIVTAPDTVRFERRLPGPIERVWAYLTESDQRGRWLAPGEMEPWVGGRIELNFRHADLSSRPDTVPEKYREFERGATVHGRVTRHEPPHVLGYSWGETAGHDSEVTFELTEDDGQVLLLLTHRRLDRAQMLDVASGWHTHLDILVDHLAGRDPEPFWIAHTHWEAEYENRLPKSEARTYPA